MYLFTPRYIFELAGEEQTKVGANDYGAEILSEEGCEGRRLNRLRVDLQIQRPAQFAKQILAFKWLRKNGFGRRAA